MFKFINLLFFFIFASHQLSAQVFPREGTTLNYRLIGFSFPQVAQANTYTIQVAEGNYSNEDTFSKNITRTFTTDTTRLIAEVPSFGAQYTWQVICPDANKSPLYHFSTGTIPAVDTAINRLQVTVPAIQYKDAAVFIDALGVLYDMRGNPIWYLPLNNEIKSTDVIRDLKLSPFGTITFIAGSRIYEISYNGKILWGKPGNYNGNKDLGKINALYHHEFTRLANGHYMALGAEDVVCKLPTASDTNFLVIPGEILKTDSNKAYRKIPFGTLVEYDEKGNIVWQWRTLKYIMESDLKYIGAATNWIDLHDNAFFFDEQNKTAYISFRDINRIIKIKYPEGNVLNTYGNKYKNGIAENLNTFFHAPHACKHSEKGYLYWFDNGTDPLAPSKIVKAREPLNEKDTLKKKWEYNCLIDGKDKYTLKGLNAGGNVIELPDNAMFASMGMQFSKVFIVNMKKEILWSAISEKWVEAQKTWQMTSSYKASIIPSRKDLEQLIWNSEKEPGPGTL